MDFCVINLCLNHSTDNIVASHMIKMKILLSLKGNLKQGDNNYMVVEAYLNTLNITTIEKSIESNLNANLVVLS